MNPGTVARLPGLGSEGWSQPRAVLRGQFAVCLPDGDQETKREGDLVVFGPGTCGSPGAPRRPREKGFQSFTSRSRRAD